MLLTMMTPTIPEIKDSSVAISKYAAISEHAANSEHMANSEHATNSE